MKFMLEENKWLGILTLLDDDNENESANNFLKAMSYRDNYKKVIHFLMSLLERFPDDYCLQLISCFNYNSDDKYENSFRRLVLEYDKQLMKEIKSLKSEFDISVERVKGIIVILFN